MALSTTEITDLRELLKTKYSTLFTSKTDTEIDTLIGYADAQTNDNCATRLLAIEYLVCYWVDTEGDSTTVTGSLTSVDVGGDIKSTFAPTESGGIYGSNYYGRLYLGVLKRCASSVIGIIV